MNALLRPSKVTVGSKALQQSKPAVAKGMAMQCGSCAENIPDDSIFCPECGSRQELSRAGGLPSVGAVGLGGQEVAGGRNFGVVSGEAVRSQRDANMSGMGGIPPEVLAQIASGMQGGQPMIPQDMAGMQPQQQSDMPLTGMGPSIGSGASGSQSLDQQISGGTTVADNPANSPTDAMVNRIAQADRNVKNERRSQWLQMNQESASNVLAQIGQELPSHLKGEQAAEVLAEAIGSKSGPQADEALLKRMTEVAIRRVARKRGVAVETPQSKVEADLLTINVTFIDDGRVLDEPADLAQAFEHAINTEIALKGMDIGVQLSLFRSKDGVVENLIGDAPADEEEDDEEMFACEICDGLVRESDSKCPHCGAIFEEEDEVSAGGPPGPGGGGPPRGGGPPGPSGGGPPRGGGPSGPSGGGPPRGGGPSGPSGGPPGGPKKSGGPPGGGPPKGGPGGGPPGGPKKSGGPSGGGPPKGGPSGGPPGGGPPKGGPSGGPPGGPKKSGGPPKGGPGGGPPGGPKKGPPGGPKRGPPK